jgi:hypothetical protein
LSQNLHAPNRPSLPRAWVQRIFRRLGAQQGGKLATLFKGSNLDDLESEWAVSLYGFRGEEIERGLNRASTFEWQMTLPAFKLLCRPCLNPEFAWYEAQACLEQRQAGEVGDWSHPAVFRAAMRMTKELNSGEPFTRFRTRWTAALELELDHGWGADVTAPKRALPAKVHKPAPCPPDQVERLAQIRREILEGIAQRKLQTTDNTPLEDPLP